jgi:uncharacterized repeat protein (TIGR01451 family)
VKASEPFAVLLGLRKINIIGPANNLRGSLPVSTDGQTFTFTIPGTTQTVIGDEALDNRGTWRADLSSITGSRRASALFDVSGTTPAADLQIIAAVNGSEAVNTGDTVSVSVYVFNSGPDAADDVVVTPPAHSGLSLQSFAPVTAAAAPADCGGPCSLASLGVRGFQQFLATYSVTAASGTRIAATATVGSATDDPRPGSNADSLTLDVGTVNPNTVCTLTCPADIVATANTTVGGELGAVVKYGAASVSGDCGAVSNNPSPDPTTGTKFFPVGTHTVTSTSETGGGSCTFSVKVLDTPAPTISCPADKFAAAASGADSASVNVGTPNYTANGGGTLSFARSDDTPAVIDEDGNVVTPEVTHTLTDPYPLGVTSILWTVADADGRTASCTQKVTVSDNACGADTTPPTITAPDDITVRTGANNPSCAVVLDDELGQADVSDNCAVNVTVSGIPAGNRFAPGTYTLVYKATDAAGNQATDTQVVTVIDDTPPVIAAPDDATYTCLSEVPAASPSQAHGPVVGPDGHFVLDANGEPVMTGSPFDNCGVTVTVSETATGVGSAASPRVITRTYTATDAAGNQASDVQTITVADGTPPVIQAPADATYQCPSEVPAASPSQATASDNCSAVNVAVSESNNGGAGSAASPLVIKRTYTATDGVGNQASATQTITVIDNTPPTLSVPADVSVYLPLNTTATSMAVTYPAATASDNCGAATISYTKPSGSVFNVGTTTVTVTATDAVGNQTTGTFKVTVLYDFFGFFAPVSNLPTLNAVNAGRAIPVKFSLSGSKGLGIFPVGTPDSQQIACDSGAPVSNLEDTLSAGGSSLSYDPASDQYNYVWKTNSVWAGTCRQLVITLNDGTTHKANFKFK